MIALTCPARSTLAEARAATLGGLARVNPLLERVHLRGGPSAIARHPMQTWSHSRTARLVIAAVGIFLRYQRRWLAWRRRRDPIASCVVRCGESPGSGDDLSPGSQQLWVRRPHGRGERHDTGQRASLRRYGNLGGIRQWIESVYGTVKDQLSLERHGGRTHAGMSARIAQRLLALAACIGHN